MSAHEISVVIRDHLNRRGWSQAELARRMDVTPGMLTHLLSGRRRWNLENLEKAANVLGIEITALTGSVPMQGQTIGRLCVELSAAEVKRFRELAADELRTPENLLHLLVLRHIQDKTKR